MRRNVALLAACQALMFIGNSALIASAALIGYQLLGEDKSLATLPLAVQFLATMLTTIPASLLMGRIGRRAGFALGSLVAIAGAATATLAIASGSFALFCVATAAIGVFNGFAIYYRFAAADQAAPDYRSKAISYVLAGGVVAAFIGPNLANWSRDLLGELFAGTMASLVVVYAVSLVLQLMLRIAPPQAQQFEARRTLLAIVRQPKFLVAAGCGMLGYATMTLVMTASPLAMHAARHQFSETAFVIQWHVFAMFAPSFFTGHLIQRFGALPIMFAGALLDCLCIAINLSGDGVWHFWSALFALGIGWNFLFVGATTLLTETYEPGERSRAQAINDFLIFTATTTSALSAGALQHLLGWQMVNVSVTLVLAVIFAALAWLYRSERAAARAVSANSQL